MMWLMHTPLAPPTSPFPLLSRIEPVLAAIEGFAEFKVIRRAAFTTVDYVYMRAESFGCLVNDPPDAHFAARLRREARGLKPRPRPLPGANLTLSWTSLTALWCTHSS